VTVYTEATKLRRYAHKAIADAGFPLSGGGSSPEEIQSLIDITRRVDARLVGEIGLNAGLSSHAFLNATPHTNVISFDLGKHTYIDEVKRIIDKEYPNRHRLIKGDSTKTIPLFIEENPSIRRFDVVFIDGGHAYRIVYADMMNMRRLSGPDTIVIMDDLCPWKPWGGGPTRVWQEAIEDNVIEQLELYQDGILVDVAQPPGTRVWGVGKYVGL
jgi:predicted O-methyltransferase YrrM